MPIAPDDQFGDNHFFFESNVDFFLKGSYNLASFLLHNYINLIHSELKRYSLFLAFSVFPNDMITLADKFRIDRHRQDVRRNAEIAGSETS